VVGHISWSRDLTVEIAGRDVINHAGAAALRIIAERSGLTARRRTRETSVIKLLKRKLHLKPGG